MLRKFLDLLRKDNMQAQALQECHEMLDVCRQMIHASIETLRRRDDATVDVDIAALDQRINSFERDVRRKVLTHLSLGNVADLSSGLVLVVIVIDIERIGDYAKNIYDIAVSHPTRLDGGPMEDRLAQLEKETMDLFDHAVAAFKEGDEDAARSLMRDYTGDVRRHYRRLEDALVGGEVELDTGTAAALALYIRFLKRISAHARNMASSVVSPFDRIGYSE